MRKNVLICFYRRITANQLEVMEWACYYKRLAGSWLKRKRNCGSGGSIHSYYTKLECLWTCLFQKQASWMIRRVFEARDHVRQLQVDEPSKHSLIRQFYKQHLGDYPKKEWISHVQECSQIRSNFYSMDLSTWPPEHCWSAGKMGHQCGSFRCVMQKFTRISEKIFRQCDFTKLFWLKILTWLQEPIIHDSNQNQQWLNQVIKGSSRRARGNRSTLKQYILSGQRAYQGVWQRGKDALLHWLKSWHVYAVWESLELWETTLSSFLMRMPSQGDEPRT